jgi:hypothetical protein
MASKDSQPPIPVPESYDPFSYPRLYPSGWNLDDLPASQNPGGFPESKPRRGSMPSWYEPFRDLRTFPAGWDLP